MKAEYFSSIIFLSFHCGTIVTKFHQTVHT